jgi:dolichol-phosphate mannosyltransferase
MYEDTNFAIITPLANEEKEFYPFVVELKVMLDRLQAGTVYFVVDNVSKDNTLTLCRELSGKDERFITIWAPENRHVVDAYIRGYSVALKNNHDIIIEMDAGLSHDPRAIPMFLRVLNEGNECAFGSRFIVGGSIYKSSFKRTLLSKGGTLLSNLLLGTRMRDMTSGYQGFHVDVVRQFVDYPWLSTGHFYQTELRYLLRKKRYAEVPIHYRAPSPNVRKRSIYNSLGVLWYYFKKRVCLKPVIID